MRFDGFIGESYTARAVNLDAQRAVCLYLETDRSGGGKSPKALVGTPGLSLFLALPTYPLRAIAVGESRLFAVAGSKFYEIFQPVTGTVNTAGSTVTWVSGNTFSAVLVGALMIIGGVNYTVQSVTSSTVLVLTASAGTQGAVAFSIPYNQRGDVGNDGNPAQIFFNGTQVMIVSAGYAWIDPGSSGPVQAQYSNGTGTVNTAGTAVSWVSGDYFTVDGTATGALDTLMIGNPFIVNGVTYTVASITDASDLVLTTSAGTQAAVAYSATYPITASCGAFMDGYFIVAKPLSKQINISGINDGLTPWDPSNYGVKEGFPDNISTMIADHEQLWLLGTQTSEIWQDTGANNFPFQRFQGGYIPRGCAAPASAVRLGGNQGDDGVAWLGMDPRGRICAYRSTGFVPVPVSTPAIEAAWAGYSTVADAISFVWAQDGHEFWVITFPTANWTWVYDPCENAWFEWPSYNGSTLQRHRGCAHGDVFGNHFVGDYANGNIYKLSPSVYTDNGQPIYRIRTAPHLSEEEEWVFGMRFRVSMLPGPNPTLSWSDDLAQTYCTAKAASSRRLSSTSDTALQNSEWRRLGRFRDRVFSLTITDACQICITDAFIDLQAGNG